MAHNLLPRRVLGVIGEQLLDRDGIVVLVGAKQVGKTSIMYLLLRWLRDENSIPSNRVFYFDLEDLRILEVVNHGVDEFIAFLKAKGANLDERCFVFLDEIQYMANPSNFLKLIADHQPNIRLTASGSSSLEIRKKFKDSLAGRKQVYEIHSLDFPEYLQFRDRKDLSDKLVESEWDGIRFSTDEYLRFFSEYALYGGLPKVALLQSTRGKADYLKEVVNSYVRKDVRDLFRMESPLAFNKFLSLLATSVGNLTNVSRFAFACNTSIKTVERYMFILENTFIVNMLRPFFTNAAKELTKMPKTYFFDSGMRNAILGDISPIDSRADVGHLVENTVFSMLWRSTRAFDKLNFWRTKAGAEVDFVRTSGKATIGYAIRYSLLTKPKISRAARSFIETYAPERFYVCTRKLYGTSKIGKTEIVFLPIFMIGAAQ